MRPKPLLFELSGTLGDQKPMAILAVHAAHAAMRLEEDSGVAPSSTPVTIAYYDDNAPHWLSAIRAFAAYMMGANFEKWLVIRAMPERSELTKKFLVFDVETTSDDPDDVGENGAILLDFGDTAGKNRFTSRLLLFHAKRKSNFFGSLFLPVHEGPDIAWSSAGGIAEMRAFRERAGPGRRMLVIAGSLQPPFYLKEILDWLQEHHHHHHPETGKSAGLERGAEGGGSDWSFLLIGYPCRLITPAERRKYARVLHCAENPIEYEDAVRAADFFVGNGGAGSVLAPAAAGCPQMVRIGRSVGRDKMDNQKIIADLGLGPRDHPEDNRMDRITFADFLVQIARNLEFYQANALRLVPFIAQEVESTSTNMLDMFTELLLSRQKQEEIVKTGRLPAEYTV